MKRNEQLQTCLQTFEDMCQFRHFPIYKRYDSSLLRLFFFILLVDSFPQTVITENDCNCCEDFVQFRHFQDLLFPGFSVFLACKQLLLNCLTLFVYPSAPRRAKTNACDLLQNQKRSIQNMELYLYSPVINYSHISHLHYLFLLDF